MENKLLLIKELSRLKEEGKDEEIVDLCSENLKSDSDNLFLLRTKAHAAYENGKIPAFSIVLTCTEKILEQSPNDIKSLILQVRTLRRLDRIDDAEISLELAERIEPDNPDVLLQKSGMLINASRLSAAKKVLNRLEKIDPQQAFINLGAIAWIEKKYDDALHFFSRCLDAEPDNFKATENKVLVLFDMERYDEAVSIADKFIEKYGERRFRMYRVLAILHYEISRTFSSKSSAEYDYQPSVFGSRILDESDEKWNDKKFLNTRKNTEHLRKALDIFKEIDKKEIHNQQTRYYKALTCIALEDVKLGTDAINDCREEENGDILSHKASFLYRQGKYEEAIEICDEVLKDYPNDPIAISTKINALWWGGDLLEYRRLFLKHHPEEKTELVQEPTSELSIQPGKKFKFRNPQNVVKILVNDVKDDLCILDPYFGLEWFGLLNEAMEQNDDINEIRIIVSIQKIVSTYGMHPLDRLEGYRLNIERIKGSFSRDKSVTIMVTKELTNMKNETNYHDRFVISQKNIWNFTSSDSIVKGDRADIHLLENQDTIDSDLERFERLWNDEKSYKITGKKNAEFKKAADDVAQRYEKYKEEKLRQMRKLEDDDTPSKLKEILDSEKKQE